jgi:hypothetical protein
MSDQQPKPDKTLSEISHLFLSSVRERQTRGASRPHRVPPGSCAQFAAATADASRADLDIHLTPEEVAQVIGEAEPEEPAAARADHGQPVAVSAVLGAHLGARQLERAKEYAAHLAACGQSVGLIELDASEFRLWCFERSHANASEIAGEADAAAQAETLDGRRMTEALGELAHDMDRWLILVPSPRVPEARALLREVQHWVVLASCDHDGIVGAYRTIKGFSESHNRNDAHGTLPRLSLALLDARNQAEAAQVFRKLAGVSEQFLHWHVEPEGPVVRSNGGSGAVRGHLVLACRGAHDKAQLATAPQWLVVTTFLRHLKTITRPSPPEAAHAGFDVAESTLRATARDHVALHATDSRNDAPEPKTGTDPVLGNSGASDPAEVLDLQPGAGTSDAIVAAVLRGAGTLVESPIRPPMCPQASVAVSRERRLVLVAAARQGLSDLRAIAQAYRWLIENRPLVAMAMPQFSIDAHQLPQLHLLVDHADLTAEILQPVFESGNVKVQAYRRLRWGDRTGLLLEAA